LQSEIGTVDVQKLKDPRALISNPGHDFMVDLLLAPYAINAGSK
jgi:hypothetical protein